MSHRDDLQVVINSLPKIIAMVNSADLEVLTGIWRTGVINPINTINELRQIIHDNTRDGKFNTVYDSFQRIADLTIDIIEMAVAAVAIGYLPETSKTIDLVLDFCSESKPKQHGKPADKEPMLFYENMGRMTIRTAPSDRQALISATIFPPDPKKK